MLADRQWAAETSNNTHTNLALLSLLTMHMYVHIASSYAVAISVYHTYYACTSRSASGCFDFLGLFMYTRNRVFVHTYFRASGH